MPARDLVAAVVDGLLPGDCAGCARPGPVLCPACARPLHGPARLAWPRPRPPGLPAPYAVARYDGSVRNALLAYKERGGLALTEILAVGLAASIRAAVSGMAPTGDRPPRPLDVVLVPMPSSRQRRRDRGLDVVLRLARRAAARSRQPAATTRVVPALRLVRPVADSAGLSAAGRRANLEGAFALRPAAVARLRQGAVVLVDDLITTGATLAEAANTLRGCGIEPAGAAVVAATVRRGGDR